MYISNVSIKKFTLKVWEELITVDTLYDYSRLPSIHYSISRCTLCTPTKNDI
jgi:hypothetical protein